MRCPDADSAANQPPGYRSPADTNTQKPIRPSGEITTAAIGRSQAPGGSHPVRADSITAASPATATAATKATAEEWTVPANMVRTPAVIHRRSATATSAQTVRAQASASEYTMDKTKAPGATAHSATRSTLIRESPVSRRPS
jgi:hypothetical protein